MTQKKIHMSGEHSSIDGECSETAARGRRHTEVVILDEFVEPRSHTPGEDYAGRSIFSLPVCKAMGRRYSPNTMSLLGLSDPDEQVFD